MLKTAVEKKKKKMLLKKALADSDTEMLNLEKDLYSLTHYADDEEELVAQMFSSIKGTKLEAMLPPILKEIPLIDLQQLCLHELRGMSQRRILSIINGQEMSGSSSEEDSDVPSRDRKDKRFQDINEDSNMTEKSLKSLNHTPQSFSREHSADNFTPKPKVMEEEIKPDDDKLAISHNLNDLDNVNEANLTALDILELELRAKLIKTMLEKQPSGDEAESPSGRGASRESELNFDPNMKIKEEPLSPEPMEVDVREPTAGKRHSKKKYSRRARSRSTSRSYSSSSSSSSSRSSYSSRSSSRSTSRSRSPPSDGKTTSRKDKLDGSESNSETKMPAKKKKITKKEFEARMKKAKANRSYRKRKESEDDSADTEKKKKRRGRSRKKVDSKKTESKSTKTPKETSTSSKTKPAFNLKEILRESNVISAEETKTPPPPPDQEELEEGEEGEILEKEEGEIDSNEEEEGACSASDQSAANSISNQKKVKDKRRSRSRSKSYYSSRSCSSSYTSGSRSYSRSPSRRRSSKYSKKKSYSKSRSSTPTGPKVPNWQSRNAAAVSASGKPTVSGKHQQRAADDHKETKEWGSQAGMEFVNSEEDFDDDSKSSKVYVLNKTERQCISFSISKKAANIKPNPDLQDDGVPVVQAASNPTATADLPKVLDVARPISQETSLNFVESNSSSNRKGMNVVKPKKKAPRPMPSISDAIERVDMENKKRTQNVQKKHEMSELSVSTGNHSVKTVNTSVIEPGLSINRDEQLMKKTTALEPALEISGLKITKDTKGETNDSLEPGEVDDFYKGADQLYFSDDNSPAEGCEDEADIETFLHDDTPVEPIHIETGMLRKSVKVVTKMEDEPPLVSWQSKDRKKKDKTKGALVMEGVGFLKTVLSESQTTIDQVDKDIAKEDIEERISPTGQHSQMETIPVDEEGEVSDTQDDVLEPLEDLEDTAAEEAHNMGIIGVIDPKADRGDPDLFDEELIGGSNWSMRWLQSEKVQKVVSNSTLLSKVRKNIQAKGKNITREKPKVVVEIRQQVSQAPVATPSLEVKQPVRGVPDKPNKPSQPVVGSIEEYEKLFGIKVKVPLTLPQGKPSAASTKPQPEPETKSSHKPLSSLLDSDDSEDDEEAALWSKIMKK